MRDALGALIARQVSPMSGDVPSPAELRRQSIWLLTHARELREEAEAARLRSANRRKQSERALASAKEMRRLVEGMLVRRCHPRA